MSDDEAVAAVTTDKARAKFVKALDAAEEWLYEGGEDAPAKEHRWAAACQTCFYRARFGCVPGGAEQGAFLFDCVNVM